MGDPDLPESERSLYPFPPIIRYLRLIEFTHWTKDQIDSHPTHFLDDLQTARIEDQRVQLKLSQQATSPRQEPQVKTRRDVADDRSALGSTYADVPDEAMASLFGARLLD